MPGKPVITNVSVDRFTVSLREFQVSVPNHPVDYFNVHITNSVRIITERVDFGSALHLVQGLPAATQHTVCVSAVHNSEESAQGPCAEVATRGKGTDENAVSLVSLVICICAFCTCQMDNWPSSLARSGMEPHTQAAKDLASSDTKFYSGERMSRSV